MNNTLLRCPSCKSSLKRSNNKLICKTHGVFYIKFGIPILINTETLSFHSKNQIKYFDTKSPVPTKSDLINLSVWKRRYIERFLENFPSIKGKKILECGTGSGYIAMGLAKKGAKVTATDITLENLIKLKQIAAKLKIEKNISFVCCSAEDLPFKNSSFDYYIANAVLEHLPKEVQAINELERITKKGGGVMITGPLKYRYLYPFFIPLNYFHDKEIGHLRRYDDLSFKKKFKLLKLTKVYYTGHLAKVLRVLVNCIYPYFDEETIEQEDKKREFIKYGSSNIIGIFTKLK